MTLNASGVMSIGGTSVGSSINLELDLAATANSAIGQTNFRELAEVPTGQISLSDFYGKSNVSSPASSIQFWGVNAPMPNSNGASRNSYTAGTVDVTRQGEVISFGDNGVTTCILTEECGLNIPTWVFTSTSLTVLKFTQDGTLPPSSAQNYTWSSAQAQTGFYGTNQIADVNRSNVRLLTGLKDFSGNYYLKTASVIVNNAGFRQGIIKLNPDLSVAWAKSFVLPGYPIVDNWTHQSVANNGDVYRWTRREGTVLKVNSSGVLQWSYIYGLYTPNTVFGLGGVGGDSLGNCYTCAQLNTGAFRLDKFDSNGTWIKGWNWPNPSSSGGAETTFAEDNAGNMWVFTRTGNYQIYQILKFDTDFNLLWQKTVTHPNTFTSIFFVSAKFDDNNNCYILTNPDIERLKLLTALSQDGTLLWSRLLNAYTQAFDLSLSQDFTKVALIGKPADLSTLSPYPEGFSRQSMSNNIAKMVLPLPVVPLTSNPLSNGTVNVTLVIDNGGTLSTPARVLTALSAPSQTAFPLTLENIAVNVSTTFPFVAKISEQLL